MRGYYTPPSGKPVLHFIHGNGFNGLVYEHFLAHFQEHFDLFLSDAQGHGGSDEGGEFVCWDTSARHFIEAWQHYAGMWSGVEKVGIGHSFGGVNTLLMTRLDDSVFDRMVLLDPIIGPPSWTMAVNGLRLLRMSKFLPLVRQAKVRGNTWKNYDAAYKYFYQRGTFKGWEDACLDSYLKHGLEPCPRGQLRLRCPPEIEAGIFGSYSKEVWRTLKELEIPTDIFFGDNTFSFIRSAVPKLCARYRAVTAHSQKGGHCFMFEQPEQSAEAVLEVLLPAREV